MTRQGTSRDALKVIEAWRIAGEKLGVTVMAPYDFIFGGRAHSCLAFLPHFGTEKGILVLGMSPPEFHTDKTIEAVAERTGVGCSILNVERYRQYDEEFFRETLCDWGYFGPDDQRPPWLVDA